MKKRCPLYRLLLHFKMTEKAPFTSVNKEFNKIQEELAHNLKLNYSEYSKLNKFAAANSLLAQSKKEYQKLNEEYKKAIKYIEKYQQYVKQLQSKIADLKDIINDLEFENAQQDNELKRKIPKLEHSETDEITDTDVEEKVLEKHRHVRDLITYLNIVIRQ